MREEEGRRDRAWGGAGAAEGIVSPRLTRATACFPLHDLIWQSLMPGGERRRASAGAGSVVSFFR